MCICIVQTSDSESVGGFFFIETFTACEVLLLVLKSAQPIFTPQLDDVKKVGFSLLCKPVTSINSSCPVYCLFSVRPFSAPFFAWF